MSIGQGSTRDLSQGRNEAFRALVDAISPETITEDGKLGSETVERLSEKLKELVGEDAVKDFEYHRNERGELLNEEGLPITEISEPVPDTEGKELETAPIIEDMPLIKLASLPSVAREKLRRQRDRILDILEEEEGQEDKRREQEEREEREEILRKRREEALDEKERLIKAKELQKKMGKALLSNLSGSDKEAENSQLKEKSPEQHGVSQTATSDRTSKKTVTFAEASDSISDSNQADWGDVTAARLRSGQRPTLQAFRSDNNPVKLNVIERNPAGQFTTTSNPGPASVQTVRDSDDESEPEDNHSLADEESDSLSAEEPTNSEEDGEVELENEYDLDYARHQREVALEYHKRRSAIGQGPRGTMGGTGEDDHENKEINSEFPAPNKHAKPSISRFKANRMASAYGASSHAETSTHTIQRAIRMGRIDGNNQLVGDERDSDSETETEGLQEALELIRKGEISNIGPDGRRLSAAPLHPQKTVTNNLSAGSSSVPQQHLPPLNRPKVSKFKVDLTKAGRPLSPRSTTSTPPTPTSHLERSSPKLPEPHAEAIIEKKPESALDAYPSHTSSSNTSTIVESSTFRAPRPTYPQTNRSAQPVAIESPSFHDRSMVITQSLVSGPDGAALPMVIVDSPSFPPPGQRASTRRPDRPPVVVSPHTHSAASNQSVLEPPAVEPVRQQSGSIMTSVVRERVVPSTTGNARDGNGTQSTHSTPQKVSRFKQARNEES